MEIHYMDIKKVVVIGSGTMGSGIAYVIATAGYSVCMVDQEQKFLDSGMSKLKQKVKEGIERNKMTPMEGQKLISRLSTSLDLGDTVKDAQLVIEAVFENMDVKKEIFTTLSQHAPKDTFLASNTSTLSISEISTVVDDPSRVVGMHFFNPAEAMKLIEIVMGEKTSEETKQQMIKFAESLGKTPVPAKDSPGFIVNRLLVPMLNEAVKLYDEGVASIEDIDKAAMLGANFPAGPFTLADMVGIDVALASQQTLHQKFGDCYKPSPSLVRLVEEGKLGLKTGEGFHKYG
jgi:3-hydroxybutyryl-CoA dehydrogenase